jgi:hypothetical protein
VLILIHEFYKCLSFCPISDIQISCLFLTTFGTHPCVLGSHFGLRSLLSFIMLSLAINMMMHSALLSISTKLTSLSYPLSFMVGKFPILTAHGQHAHAAHSSASTLCYWLPCNETEQRMSIRSWIWYLLLRNNFISFFSNINYPIYKSVHQKPTIQDVIELFTYLPI